MNKIRILEQKRLFKELEYIQTEHDYKNEVISTIDSEFINSVNLYLEKNQELKKAFEELYNSKIEENLKKKQESKNKTIILFDENGEKIEKETDVEGWFEQILDEDNKPINLFDENNNKIDLEFDKYGNSRIRKEDIKDIKSSKIKKYYREIVKLTHPDKVQNKKLNDFYITATEYYNDNDLIAIYSICSELYIDYELDDNDYELIKMKINNLNQKVKFMESTYTWKWYNVDDSEKDKVVEQYILLQLKSLI
jgi:hypothetical protein